MKASRLLAILLFISLLICDYLLGSRGYVLAYSVFAIFVCVGLRCSLVSTFAEYPRLTAMLVLPPAFGTFHAVLIGGQEVSVYQIIRSQFWTILAVVAGLAIVVWSSKRSNAYLYKILRVAGGYVTLSAVFGVMDFFFGTHMAPSQIRQIEDVEGAKRLYLSGIEVAIAFIPIFAASRMYLAFVASVIVLLLTGGKIALLLASVAVLYSLKGANAKLGAKLTLFVLLSAAVVSYAVQIEERIGTFLEEGDLRRVEQIQDGYSAFGQNLGTKLFGIGLGVAYSDGYFAHSVDGRANPEKEALFENSRYDVENGFIYMLLRFGLIGGAAFLMLFGRNFGGYRAYAYLICFALWLGGSPVGAAFFVQMVMFGMAASVFLRVRS